MTTPHTGSMVAGALLVVAIGGAFEMTADDAPHDRPGATSSPACGPDGVLHQALDGWYHTIDDRLEA